MDPRQIRALLEAVRDGDRDVDDALEALRDLPFRELGGFATVDHHRALRTGFPEVVFGAGKTPTQIAAILSEIDGRGQPALATRVSPEAGAHLTAELPDARWDPTSRTVVLRREPPRRLGAAPLLVLAAGTSDLPVAEEAAITAETFGNEVRRVYDVGVAGLHRLLAKRAALDAAGVIVVVAGMEGALPSVVAGLVSKPVIAVPTSVGYGASFDGLAALLTMLNSCASGVTVVNIDNGFGAAYAASLVQRGAGAP